MYICLSTSALTDIVKITFHWRYEEKVRKEPTFKYPYEKQIYLISCGIWWQHTEHDDVTWPLVVLYICSIVLVLLFQILKCQFRCGIRASLLCPNWKRLQTQKQQCNQHQHTKLFHPSIHPLPFPAVIAWRLGDTLTGHQFTTRPQRNSLSNTQTQGEHGNEELLTHACMQQHKKKQKNLTLVREGWSTLQLTLLLAVSRDNLSSTCCLATRNNSIPSEWLPPAPQLPSLFPRTGAVLSVKPLSSFVRGRSSRLVRTGCSNLGGLSIRRRKRREEGEGWGLWQEGHGPHLSSSPGSWDPSPLRGKIERSWKSGTSGGRSSQA